MRSEEVGEDRAGVGEGEEEEEAPPPKDEDGDGSEDRWSEKRTRSVAWTVCASPCIWNEKSGNLDISPSKTSSV